MARRWRLHDAAKAEMKKLAEKNPKDAASIVAAMREVRVEGRGHPDLNQVKAAIWQIEVDGDNVIYRLLFAQEGAHDEILLGLHLINKKQQKTPKNAIDNAEKRLREWKAVGAAKRRPLKARPAAKA